MIMETFKKIVKAVVMSAILTAGSVCLAGCSDAQVIHDIVTNITTIIYY